MKCRIMQHFIRVYTDCKGKKDIYIFFNYNLTPLDTYVQWTVQSLLIKPEGRIHIRIQRVNVTV